MSFWVSDVHCQAHMSCLTFYTGSICHANYSIGARAVGPVFIGTLMLDNGGHLRLLLVFVSDVWESVDPLEELGSRFEVRCLSNMSQGTRKMNTRPCLFIAYTFLEHAFNAALKAPPNSKTHSNVTHIIGFSNSFWRLHPKKQICKITRLSVKNLKLVSRFESTRNDLQISSRATSQKWS